MPHLLQDELAVRGKEEYGEGAVQHAAVDVVHDVRCNKNQNHDGYVVI
jgi:hypothetical protein